MMLTFWNLNPGLSFTATPFIPPFLLKGTVNITFDFLPICFLIESCQGFVNQQYVSRRVWFWPSHVFPPPPSYFSSSPVFSSTAKSCGLSHLSEVEFRWNQGEGEWQRSLFCVTKSLATRPPFSLAVEESQWETGQGTGSPWEDRIQSRSKVRGFSMCFFSVKKGTLPVPGGLIGWLTGLRSRDHAFVFVQVSSSHVLPRMCLSLRHMLRCAWATCSSKLPWDQKQYVWNFNYFFIFLFLKTK